MTMLIVKSWIVHLTPILGCSYHLHSSHHFLSTWGAVMLEKKKGCLLIEDTVPTVFNTAFEGKGQTIGPHFVACSICCRASMQGGMGLGNCQLQSVHIHG